VRLRTGGRPLVVAHRGASAEAPENSLAAIELGVAAGADLVEIDISPGLVVTHDAGSSGPALDDVLELLAPTRVGVHADLKAMGYERAVVDALDRHGLRDRALVSTAYAASGRRVRALAPELPVAIGYPRDRLGVSGLPWPSWLVLPGAALVRALMPVRIPLLLAAARANVLALHHGLCSAAAIAAAHRRHARVLVWTVDEPDEIRRFAALGVDGIVSNDPKIAVATLTGS
jgi:glycerophosphoryl diester phosphodiesterase